MPVNRGTLVLLALSLALVVAGVQYAHYGDQPPTDYRVEPATAADAEAAANDTYEPDWQVVYHYENLSDTAQRAFRSALDAPDGRVSYLGSENRAPEFIYLSDTAGSPGAGNYYVRYEGNYYHLTTYGAGMDFGFDALGAAFLTMAGFGATIGGAVRADDARLRVAALAGLLAMGATYALRFDWFGVHGLSALLALGAVVAFGAVAAGWLATDRLAG
jgi:hypothetical protein